MAKNYSTLFFVLITLFFSTNLFSKEKKDVSESLKTVGPVLDKLKLGILINNDTHQIYRSRGLGEGGLEDLKEFTEENSLKFPRTIISMNYRGYKFPFYSVLEEYKLQKQYNYKLYHSYGFGLRTYLDGYNPYDPTQDIDDEEKLGRRARKIFDLRADGIDGGISTFFDVLDLILDVNNQPVLFHCFGGRHRTGMIALALRYIQGGKWTDSIVAEEKGIRMNLAQYEYYRFNRSMFRPENLEFIEKLKTDLRFLYLKQKFQANLNLK